MIAVIKWSGCLLARSDDNLFQFESWKVWIVVIIIWKLLQLCLLILFQFRNQTTSIIFCIKSSLFLKFNKAINYKINSLMILYVRNINKTLFVKILNIRKNQNNKGKQIPLPQYQLIQKSWNLTCKIYVKVSHLKFLS